MEIDLLSVLSRHCNGCFSSFTIHTPRKQYSCHVTETRFSTAFCWTQKKLLLGWMKSQCSISRVCHDFVFFLDSTPPIRRSSEILLLTPSMPPDAALGAFLWSSRTFSNSGSSLKWVVYESHLLYFSLQLSLVMPWVILETLWETERRGWEDLDRCSQISIWWFLWWSGELRKEESAFPRNEPPIWLSSSKWPTLKLSYTSNTKQIQYVVLVYSFIYAKIIWKRRLSIW